jgi:hypothetical protein
MFRRSWLSGFLFLACLAAPFAFGQEAYRESWFPFVITDAADEETAGTPIDLSHLNPLPAGAHGYLRADGERIVDGRGQEVRLYGSNICDYHPMPPKADAPRIARRLKQFGFNFIRLHYFDFAKAPAGILNADMQTLNPEKLDEFDWLIANLKENGIYVDINLHVCRPYPNMPEGIHRFGKGIDFIHAPYIESQKRYARDLIGHRNPYTGMTYAEDPAVALIEINNENTVFSIWSKLAGMPEEFSKPIQERWNRWLAQKYGSTKELRRAWNSDAESVLGPELLENGDFSQGTASWHFEHVKPGEATAAVVTDPEQGSCLRWTVSKQGTADWHLQFYAKDLPVEHGKKYAMTFKARCLDATPKRLFFRMMMQREPWLNGGGSADFQIDGEWRQYAMNCSIENPEAIPLRLNFSANNKLVNFEIAAVSLREGMYAVKGLHEGESLEAANIPLVADTACTARTLDFHLFLIDAEADYVQAMRRVLEDELGYQGMVLCSQANYGGLAGYLRESRHSDLIDMHSYPCHPSTVIDEQGQRTQHVRNESLVAKAFGSLESSSLWRAAGMPFVMTESDVNPPNDHASENFPLLALIAAYQGWSGFAEYSWYNFQQNEIDHRRIRSHYATTGHAGQMAFVPSMALLYRQGLVKEAFEPLALRWNEEELAGQFLSNSWYGMRQLFGRLRGDISDVWRRRVSNSYIRATDEDSSLRGSSGKDTSHILSDTGEILFDRRQEGEEFLQVTAPAARLLIGYVGGRNFTLGDVVLRMGSGTHRNYANISLVALDEKPIAESRRVLLTAVARVENKFQQWNEKRTSIGRNWGEGPTLAEPVPLSISLPGGGWRASTLSGKGQVVATVPMQGNALSSAPGHGTLWYLFERD